MSTTYKDLAGKLVTEVDEFAFNHIRPEMEKLGFIVSNWEKGDPEYYICMYNGEDDSSGYLLTMEIEIQFDLDHVPSSSSIFECGEVMGDITATDTKTDEVISLKEVGTVEAFVGAIKKVVDTKRG